jgi:hypothetical protein
VSSSGIHQSSAQGAERKEKKGRRGGSTDKLCPTAPVARPSTCRFLLRKIKKHRLLLMPDYFYYYSTMANNFQLLIFEEEEEEEEEAEEAEEALAR